MTNNNCLLDFINIRSKQINIYSNTTVKHLSIQNYIKGTHSNYQKIPQPIESSFPFKAIEYKNKENKSIFNISEYFNSQLEEEDTSIFGSNEETIMNFLLLEEANKIVQEQTIRLDERLKSLRDDVIDRKYYNPNNINHVLSMAQFIQHERLLEDCEDLVIKILSCKEDLLNEFNIAEIIDFFIYASTLPFKKISLNKEVMERIEIIMLTKLNVTNLLEEVNSFKAVLLYNIISSCVSLNSNNNKVRFKKLTDTIINVLIESNDKFNSMVKFSFGFNAIFENNMDIYEKFPYENILDFSNSKNELDRLFFKDYKDFIRICYLNNIELCYKKEIDFNMKLMAMHLLPKMTTDYLIINHDLPMKQKINILEESKQITKNYIIETMRSNSYNIAENCGTLISNVSNYFNIDNDLLNNIISFCSLNINKMGLTGKVELLYTSLKCRNQTLFSPKTIAVLKVLIKEICKNENSLHLNIEKHAMANIYKSQIKRIEIGYQELQKKHKGNINNVFDNLISRSINYFPFAGVDYTKEIDVMYNNFMKFELYKYNRNK